MLSFNFNKYIISKDLRDYIKKSNDIAFNKLREKYSKNIISYKVNNNMNKEHPSDYEFNFCDLSENCDCDECNDYKNRIKKSKNDDDDKKIINYQGNKYISFFFMVIGGGTFISVSLLCYNSYIKK
jgi:hypothetical protein